MFKVATIYRIGDRATKSLLTENSLQGVLEEETARDPDKTVWAHAGFSNINDTPLFVGSDQSRVLNLQIRERILPGKVIRTKVAEKAAEYAERQGYKCGKKQLAEIKEEIVAALLPVSHIKRTDVPIMVSGDYLFIGSGSARIVDVAISVLRDLFPDQMMTFKLLPAKRNTTAWMTNLILTGSGSDAEVVVSAGSSAVLKGPEKKTARFKDVALSSEPVQDAIRDGFKPTEVAVDYEDRLSFNLTDQLVLKSIKFASVLLKETQEDAQGDTMAFFDGTVALVAGELKKVLATLLSEMPEEDEEEL